MLVYFQLTELGTTFWSNTPLSENWRYRCLWLGINSFFEVQTKFALSDGYGRLGFHYLGFTAQIEDSQNGNGVAKQPL